MMVGAHAVHLVMFVATAVLGASFATAPSSPPIEKVSKFGWLHRVNADESNSASILGRLSMMTSGEHTKLGAPPGEDVVLLDHEGVQIAMMLTYVGVIFVRSLLQKVNGTTRYWSRKPSSKFKTPTPQHPAHVQPSHWFSSLLAVFFESNPISSMSCRRHDTLYRRGVEATREHQPQFVQL